MAVDDLQSLLRAYFDAAHAPGALDEKTKELIHLALVLAMHRESSAIKHFTAAKQLGASDEEIEETVQLAAAVAAGSLVAMAQRARKAAESEAKWLQPGTQA